jgi:hypothetical protein
MPPPVAPAKLDTRWTLHEKAGVWRLLPAGALGGLAAVRLHRQASIERTPAKELSVACSVHTEAARLLSDALLVRLRARRRRA